jgi:Ribonuclease G/E
VKGSQVLFDQISGRGAAVRIVDGRLDDLLIDPPEDRIRPGTIYRAKAGRPMKGQGGMILQTPDGPLFLRQSKGIAQGQTVFVQTTTYAEPAKAAPAALKLLLKSRFCLLTPGASGRNISKAIRDEERRVELQEIIHSIALPEGAGLVVRTAAEEADDDEIAADLTALADLAGSLISEPREGPPEKLLDGPLASETALRDWPRPDVFEDAPGCFSETGVDEMIDDVRQPEVRFSDGSMYVEATRALVAVDVNTAGNTNAAAGLSANIAALRALPRALRLRGLGGQIVLDMAPMAKRERKRVEDAAKAAFRSDGIETSFVGWTPLGHMEFLRKRERLPLEEALK